VTSESAATGIDRDQLTRYLARVLGGRVEALDARSLVVSRTRPAKGFGHDYPADRAWQARYGHAAYNSFPRQLVCPNDICGERERAVRWRLGSSPSSAGLERPAPAPDMVLGYEASLSPELALHTDHDFSVNVDAFLRLAERLQRAATAEGYAPRPVA